MTATHEKLPSKDSTLITGLRAATTPIADRMAPRAIT